MKVSFGVEGDSLAGRELREGLKIYVRVGVSVCVFVCVCVCGNPSAVTVPCGESHRARQETNAVQPHTHTYTL